jgi:hypothetical protein
MLEIKSTKKLVKIDDKEYNLKSPTYKDSKCYNDDLATCGDDTEKKVECLFNYLAKLGLPKEVSQELELSSVLEVMDYLMGQKKS